MHSLWFEVSEQGFEATSNKEKTSEPLTGRNFRVMEISELTPITKQT
jgi:hypothetical protein